MVYQTVPLRFQQSVTNGEFLNITKDTRLIILPNWNSSTEYCSELQSKDITVHCKATGIPTPQICILVNGNITEPYLLGKDGSQLLIRLAPISYGEVMMFECQAFTMALTLNVTVNLTYTCKLLIWILILFLKLMTKYRTLKVIYTSLLPYTLYCT